MGLEADGIDAFFRSLARGQIVQPLDDTFLLEIDGDGAASPGHRKPLREPVNCDDLLGTQQHSTSDRHLPHRAAAPDGHRVRRLNVALNGALPAGRKDIRQKQQLLIRDAIRNLDMSSVRKWNAQILRLAARITASKMSVSEQPSRGVAEGGITELFVAVGPLANREVPAFALVAFAADDRERYDHPVAYLERVLRSGANFHDFAHGLMPHDVSGFHSRHEMIEQVKVRAADRTTGDLDDRVSFMLDLWIGDAFATNIGCAVPDQRLHLDLHSFDRPLVLEPERSALVPEQTGCGTAIRSGGTA